MRNYCNYDASFLPKAIKVKCVECHRRDWIDEDEIVYGVAYYCEFCQEELTDNEYIEAK